jgi:hypothetical protein
MVKVSDTNGSEIAASQGASTLENVTQHLTDNANRLLKPTDGYGMYLTQAASCLDFFPIAALSLSPSPTTDPPLPLPLQLRV